MWASVLAGQALLGAKRDANADGVIKLSEISLIENQESVFYESLGLLLKDISTFIRNTPFATAAGAALRAIDNAQIFYDKIYGIDANPRPHIDVPLGIAFVADVTSAISDTANETKF